MSTRRRVGSALTATLAVLAITLAGAIVGVANAAPAIAADASSPLPPVLQRDEDVVTGDPLPTVQIDNGYVWSQVTVGTTVYAVGQFANARPAMTTPGTALISRSNILAFDITTGELLPFAPTVNGSIKAVAASPDGSRIYIGGSFNSVNGQTRWNIAALDARTGQLVPGFAPSIGGSGVYALAADSSSVYVGGLFTQANGTPRKNLAAFSAANGALNTNWTAQTDQQVDAMVMDPNGGQVIVGGRFADVNGDGTWRGLVAIATTTGQVNAAWAGTEKVKNGWATGASKGKAGIFALNADASGVYGTGWVYAAAEIGNLEGVFALEAGSGSTRWLADCLGDHYGVYSTGKVVYSTTHTHACDTMGLWPEQSPRTHRFIHAMTADARGTLGRQTHVPQYKNWEGEAAPSAYAWYPDFAVGTTSGLGQAGLSITGTGAYISVAGEFRAVNNRQFEGIVRFSTAPPGGAKDGPRTTTASWGAPTAQTAMPGRIRVSIAGTWDRDDYALTYELLRDGTTAPVATTTLSNGWWNVPRVTLEDTTVAPGQSYTYRVRVKDGNGNAVTSGPVTAQAAAGASPAYAEAVLADGAGLYLPLGSSQDDWAGGNVPSFDSGVQARTGASVVGSATGYSSFSGNTSGRVTASAVRAPVTSAFSAELWFRTTTTWGGKLIGFGDAQSGTSGSYDRHIYMTNDGRLTFGVYPGTVRTVSSAQSYRDGQWHHVVASQDATGIKLYVDGQLVASDAGTTTAQGYDGYWRIGGDNLNGWSNQPWSSWFDGDIDEVAVYPSALTASQVQTHHAIGTGALPPTAGLVVTANELTATADASTSAGANGSTITGYAWDFGDGSPIVTRTTPTTSHTYTASGSYTVTLTVTDNRGLTSTTSQSVSVLGANQLPVAAITATAQGLTVTADASASTDPDGSIVSYDWNWGDSSANSSGVTASHQYAAAGTYTVSVVVTDDRGGTHTATREVTVSHAAPVANFTTAISGLGVTVDGAGSSASDGATLTYSWNWGDGSAPTTGVSASHTYATDGTFEVVLTVTDSLGGSASTTRTVDVRSTVYAISDDFTRTVTSGWGTADKGGVWTTMHGSATAASVTGSQGQITLAPTGTRAMALQSTSLTNVSAELQYQTQFGPSTGTGYVGLVLRQSASDGYTVQVWHRPNGTVWLVAQRAGVTIATQPVNGLTWDTNDAFTLKSEVSGSSPTTIRAKVWKTGSAEPTGWQLNATDAAPQLQGAGFVSVRYALGAASQASGTVVFDRIAVQNLDAAANVAPVAAFTTAVTDLTVAVDGSTSTDADGSIVSYAWSWGDGSPDTTGASATASHPYTAAGTYPVTLTVTDDDGATHQVSHSVTVTAPAAANVAPVAAFTTAATDLTVAVDGSTSTDADGSIVSYAWSWGDGSPDTTGASATASHPYAAAGTYPVTLTVTDDDGATHQVSHSVTVTAPAGETRVIRDTFERSTSSSWGAADLGGAWTVTGGSAAALSVSNGAGRFALAPGGTRIALLNGTPVRNYDARVTLAISAGPETGSAYAGIVARTVGSESYVVHAWLRPNGSIWLVAQRGSAVLQTAVIPGTYAAGDTFSLRLEVTGTTSTTLKAKLWRATDAEPAAWQVSVTDATAALQTEGTMGLRANRPAASTSAAEIAFDNLEVTPLP